MLLVKVMGNGEQKVEMESQIYDIPEHIMRGSGSEVRRVPHYGRLIYVFSFTVCFAIAEVYEPCTKNEARTLTGEIGLINPKMTIKLSLVYLKYIYTGKKKRLSFSSNEINSDPYSVLE